VPTVAASVDLVVHLGIDHHGVRRVNEIVAVPGRVENDVIETASVFHRSGADLVVGGGMPPRLESYTRHGINIHDILSGGR
jgi:pilus assembly protein CpaF